MSRAEAQPREEPMRVEREVVNGWADDLLNTARSGFNFHQSVPSAKSYDQRQIEALHWMAGEVRALRLVLAADTESEGK